MLNVDSFTEESVRNYSPSGLIVNFTLRLYLLHTSRRDKTIQPKIKTIQSKRAKDVLPPAIWILYPSLPRCASRGDER